MPLPFLDGHAIAITRFAQTAFYHGEYYTYNLTLSMKRLYFDAIVICIKSLLAHAFFQKRHEMGVSDRLY